MTKEKSAGAVVYRISDDDDLYFLLLQPMPGKPWGFPKGKIDPEEAEEEAARREIAEESGITDIDLDLGFRVAIRYTYRHHQTVIRKSVVYFIARAFTPDVKISAEHVAYRWSTLQEALELVVYENAQNTLQKAYDYLMHKHKLS